MMENRDKKELKQIAIDMLAGRIFTDRQLPYGHSIESCFMVLFFMNSEQKEALILDPPGLIFEYISKAMSRSCNGMPCFPSMQMISQYDTEIVFDYCKKLKEAEESVL